MAHCAVCGCDLPGLERLCKECFEKEYATGGSWNKLGLKDFRWVLVYGLSVLFYFAVFDYLIPRVPQRYLQWMDSTGHFFGVLYGAVALTYVAVIAMFGAANSIKWRSELSLLYWIVVVSNITVVFLLFYTSHS